MEFLIRTALFAALLPCNPKNNRMKLFKIIIPCIVLLASANSALFAQDEINSEGLRRYALLNEVVTLMKKDISSEINKMIKAQDGMTGKRYKELSATKGDAAKLQTIVAKDFEISFLELTNKFKEERIESIKIVNTELATKMVGNKGKTYKSIKAELKTNEALKTRYDAIMAQLQTEFQETE